MANSDIEWDGVADVPLPLEAETRGVKTKQKVPERTLSGAQYSDPMELPNGHSQAVVTIERQTTANSTRGGGTGTTGIIWMEVSLDGGSNWLVGPRAGISGGVFEHYIEGERSTSQLIIGAPIIFQGENIASGLPEGANRLFRIGTSFSANWLSEIEIETQ